MSKNNYYIYFHINPIKKEVFYIGKGKGDRAKRKNGRNKLWENIVKKYGYTIEYPHKNISEEEAFNLEVYYINKFGRKDLGKGSLANLTDGGEGSSGNILTQEHKDKISKKLKGRVFSEEHIKKNIESKLGKKRSKETCNNISESRKGIKLSDETKRKISEAGKVRTHSKETKNKMSISQKGKIVSEKTKQKLKQHKNNKPVLQFDIDENLINEFISIRDAAKQNDLDMSRIWKCCHKKAKTTGGFKWEFKNN